MRILLAGIGNIFFGDDAFGVEVARHLLQRDWPEGVRVADFGIRSYDLAYAMMDDTDVTVLVDATPRGHPPGTLSLIEPNLSALDALDGEVVNGHSLDPVGVLHLVRSLGGEPSRVLLVGCEPAVLETADGHLGLSAPVERAVPEAVTMIESLVRALLRAAPSESPGLAEALVEPR